MTNELCELRWRRGPDEAFCELEYRASIPCCDASGAVCGFIWGPWRTVKDAEQQAMDDLAASGGIVDAP